MFNNLKKIFNFKLDSQEEKVRNFTLIFLLVLWFINPNNKFIVLFFFVFLCILIYLTKKIDISLVLTFFLSSFFSVGKTYFIQLLDLKQFPDLIDLYPIGLVSKMQISVSDVIFVFLVAYSIIMFYKKRVNPNKVTFVDISLIIFFLYGIFADIFVSNNVFLSLFYKKSLFEFIFVYFMIRFIVKDHSFFFKLFLSALISLTLFETFVSLQQFIHSSPIGNALEANFSIEPPNGAIDELTFVFRTIGTFSHANVFALFLTTILPFYLFFMIKFKKYLLKIISFLTVVCLILTSSRAAWLASLISVLSILYYFEYHKKIILMRSLSLKKIVLCLFLAIPLFFYSMPRVARISNIFQRGSGLEMRVRQTIEVAGLISQSPLFGTGSGMSVVKAMTKNPQGVFADFPSPIHNYFLLLAAENGLPYLGFFVIFLFFSFKKLIQYKKILSSVIFICLLNMIFIGFFQPFIIISLLFVLLAFDYDKINEDSYDF